MLLLTILLQSGSFDWLSNPLQALPHLPAAIDGTVAFVMLFLTIYVALISFLPLEEPPIASMGIVSLSFFMAIGVIAQILLKAGNLDGSFTPGIIRDFVIFGLSMIFARNSWIGLLILLVYVYAWGLPDAMHRCGTGCPFESIEPYLWRLYR